MDDTKDANKEKGNGGDGAENLTLSEIAIQHFTSVLKDKKASDTAKTSAANGLAQIDRQREKAQAGVVHRLTRAELCAEIKRVREMV